MDSGHCRTPFGLTVCPAMKVQSQEFERMRHWFAHVSQRAFPPQLIVQAQPIAQLDELAKRSAAKAREGLSMAINDLIETTDGWPAQDVQAIDAELSKEGLPTLTEMRVRFAKGVTRAVRRGRIKDDVQYHAVRNAAELAEDKAGPLWSLLSAYETTRITAKHHPKNSLIGNL